MPEHYSRGPRATRQISPRARAMAAVGLAGGRITAGAGSNLLGQQAVDRVERHLAAVVGDVDLVRELPVGRRELVVGPGQLFVGLAGLGHLRAEDGAGLVLLPQQQGRQQEQEDSRGSKWKQTSIGLEVQF